MYDETLPSSITIRRATASDADTILAVLQDAARWLLARGIDQWHPEQFDGTYREAVLRHIVPGEIFLAERDGVAVGTFALQWTDEHIWGPQSPVAGYVHWLAVISAASGRGLGRVMLDWAGRQVAAAGRPLLRLDCTRDNPNLRAFYERAGFRYVGDTAGKMWAVSLYERPTAAARMSAADEPTGKGTLTIRPAEPGDVETLVAIEESASDWLRSRGIDPGQPPRPLREIMADRVRERVVYLALLDDSPAGTLTLLWGPEDVWADLPGDAAYVHGLMVHRDFAGRGVGRRMLAWAEAQARAAGKPLLRLDCDALNPALRAYYERAGFTPCGEVTLPHRVAARYEKLVAPLGTSTPYTTEARPGDEGQLAGEAGLATTLDMAAEDEGEGSQ